MDKRITEISKHINDFGKRNFATCEAKYHKQENEMQKCVSAFPQENNVEKQKFQHYMSAKISDATAMQQGAYFYSQSHW